MNKQRPRGSPEYPTLSPNLPEDLILQILLRLPVRSLLGFKSVCKSWRSLISDPQLGKSHFDLAAAPTHRCLVKINNFKFESLDVDASFHDESSKVNLKFPLFPSPRRYTGDLGLHIQILGSCRGFIALLCPGGGVIVWNPSTCIQRIIADDDIEMNINGNHGFGYDKSTDDYLLVLIDLIPLELLLEEETTVADYHSSIEIFSLKSHSLFYPEPIPYAKMDGWDNSSLGSFLDDALHWLVINAETYLHAIIAFDLVERSLSEIPLSPILAEKLQHQLYYLRVMGECLSLCYSGGATSMAEIWMMKEYKVQSSWTKLFAFSTCDIPKYFFCPLCFTKHGRIFGTNGFDKLVILNDKGWLLDQCTTWPEYLNNFFCLSNCSMYRESLLSLPNDFEEESGDFKEESGDFEEVNEDDQLMSSLEEAREDDQ